MARSMRWCPHATTGPSPWPARNHTQASCYTEYPDTEHNAWDLTYRNPAVWEWMFNQRRQ